MRKNRSKIVCIKLVHLPYIYDARSHIYIACCALTTGDRWIGRLLEKRAWPRRGTFMALTFRDWRKTRRIAGVAVEVLIENILNTIQRTAATSYAV